MKIKDKKTISPKFFLISLLLHIVIILALITISKFNNVSQRKPFMDVTHISIEGDPLEVIGILGIKSKEKKTLVKKEERGVSDLEQKLPGAGLDGGTDLEIPDNYLGSILRKINDNKHYPRLARRMKIEGISKISFTIKNDGSLIRYEIVSSSNNISLDEAAIETIVRASPFAPFPKEIEEEEIDLTVDIEFRI